MKVSSPGVMGSDLAGLAGMLVNVYLDANWAPPGQLFRLSSIHAASSKSGLEF